MTAQAPEATAPTFGRVVARATIVRPARVCGGSIDAPVTTPYSPIMGPRVQLTVEMPLWLGAILLAALEGLIAAGLFALLPDAAAAVIWMSAMLAFTGWAVWQIRRGRIE